MVTLTYEEITREKKCKCTSAFQQRLQHKALQAKISW